MRRHQLHICLSVFIAWLASGRSARSQAIYSALTVDSTVNEIIRCADGGYFSWKHTGLYGLSGGLTVYKYDAQLNPIWAKRVDGAEWNNVSSARTPDGGICLVGRLPWTWLWDSTQLAVMRFGSDGTPLWYRTINLPVWNAETYEHRYHGVEVSGLGEVFIKIQHTGGDYILKLGTTGLPQWMVQVAGLNTHLTSILPDESRGCYFTIERAAGASTWETFSLGRLGATGTTLWHRTFTWPVGSFTELRLRSAPNGEVYLGGLEHSDLLFMRFTADGEPVWFRYFVPDVPYTTCPVTFFRGLASATDGRSAIAAAYNATPNYSLILMDEAGHMVTGHKLPELVSAGWSEKVYIEDLYALGNELSIPSTISRTNEPAYETRAMAITTPFTIDSECRFQPMDFEEVDVPLAELTNGTLPDGVMFNTPEARDLGIQVSSMPLWSSGTICTATSILSAAAHDQGQWLQQSVVRQGDPLRWNTLGNATLRITDNAGRSVAQISVGISSPSEYNTSHLVSGMYLATFILNSNLQQSSERFVVH